MSIDNCSDYHCEGGENHTHIGIQPHLRKVLNEKGELVDGKTGEPYKEDSDESNRNND